MERTGKIHIYMGEGKGKTTAAAGLALRCAGQGGRVMVMQFLKAGDSGELAAFEDVDGITVLPSPGYYGFTWEMSERDKEDAARMYSQAMDNLVFNAQQGQFSLIVLDEIIAAVSGGILTDAQVLEWLEDLPDEPDIVLTGRYPSDELLAVGDYITEMRKIKHPYDQGLHARKGIEY
ncbi:MAG: cob(I)yrinic acid a,c-diamide adenosyltransferase [Firmicutes bacterium]|nr:cob(I)yrinic acid a,c-diamide adenosyltransferase [Bacillota bacterium]